MKNSLNKEVVAAIESHLPKGENIVTYLTGLLTLGKESIYRRLRSEIGFSYEEVATIAFDLQLSVDNIITLKNSDHAIFELNLPALPNREDIYHQNIKYLTHFFSEEGIVKTLNSIFAVNYMPYPFVMYFDALPKFYYYKWLHQTQEHASDYKMADVFTPQKIIDFQKAWRETDRSKTSFTFIVDQNLFLSTIREIQYFHERECITAAELKELQRELFLLVDGMENMTQRGVTITGAQTQLYVSDVDIDACYGYFEYDNTRCCHIHTHGINILQSYYTHACDAQYDWMEVLIRSSTLVTQCNEMYRFEYFGRQREYISTMVT